MSSLDLDQLQKRSARVTVEYGEDTVVLTYRPERIDAATARRLRKLVESPEQEEDLVEILAVLIADWDITQSGKPLPVTPESLRKIPIALMGSLASGIFTDVAAAKKVASPSPAG